jgi:hypothetical protein
LHLPILRKALLVLLVIGGASHLAACSKDVQWDEEVQLKDGRVIVATQRRRCEGGDYRAKTDASCMARESWLTFSLPEFSGEKIVWHESLKPMVLNVHQGKLFVIGRAPSTLEFRTYGATNPPYFGFRWADGAWVRIPFSEIPDAIYDANMLIENIPTTATTFLTVGEKNSARENGNLAYPAYLRRVDPRHKTSAY